MFWYDYIKPKYEEKAKLCSMVIQIAFQLTYKQKIFMETLQIVKGKRPLPRITTKKQLN